MVALIIVHTTERRSYLSNAFLTPSKLSYYVTGSISIVSKPVFYRMQITQKKLTEWFSSSSNAVTKRDKVIKFSFLIFCEGLGFHLKMV